MRTLKQRRSIAVLAVIALGALATGCSSASNQAAFTGLRGFNSGMRPAEFTIGTAHAAIEAQRHVREHAVAGIHRNYRSGRSL